MTDTTSSNAPDPEASAQPSVDTSELMSEMVAYGKELLDRVSERATQTTELVREKGYDADQWVRDVEWFWENVKNDSVRAAKYWAERYPGR